MAKAGRNDACPCGSGKKYKKCCEAKTTGSQTSRIALVVGAILVAILLVFALMDRDRGAGPGRVWSEEHGHYHAP